MARRERKDALHQGHRLGDGAKQEIGFDGFAGQAASDGAAGKQRANLGSKQQ